MIDILPAWVVYIPGRFLATYIVYKSPKLLFSDKLTYINCSLSDLALTAAQAVVWETPPAGGVVPHDQPLDLGAEQPDLVSLAEHDPSEREEVR